MKKNTKVQFKFNRIKKQYYSIKQDVAKTRTKKLWHAESVIRNKIKALESLHANHIAEYQKIYDGYVELLGTVSVRLLDSYNKNNRTNYQFEDIIQDNYRGYLKSGIISVLVSNHIPKLVVEEFNQRLPQNPKDEYPKARQLKRTFYLHLGETNTGKTYNAMQRLKRSQQGIYLSPLRILALENYERLNEENVPCHLLTGEEEIIVEGAHHSSCTVEKANLTKSYEVAIIDEVQLMADSQRGDAWTRAILGLACPEIHLCGALNAKEELIKIIEDCGDEIEIIAYSRLVPLQIQKTCFKLSDIQPGDALVAFSKRRVLSLSQNLTDRGIPNSVIYGNLPPEVRKLQYDSFMSGESPVLVSTDAIGMGVNLPIRRIIFTEVKKFDGEEVRLLSSQEVKQIAGRAGRIGIYEVGYVACMEHAISFIEEQLETQDDDITEAVVGPSEAILKIGGLPLKEKLALWSTREESLKYYRKKDVRDYILVLDQLKPFKIPEPVQWRLMLIPFDVHSDALLNQFIDYLEECFTLKAEELTKPMLESVSLQSYEEYYQKINLYYSFSKTMDLTFDEQWVYDTRKTVSEEMNMLL